MPITKIWLAALALTAIAFGPVRAAQTSVAVAANFTEPGKEIAAAFKTQTGQEAVLSFGASGQFYAQIKQDAPFQILLSADEDRPSQLVRDGLALDAWRFTYAIGKLVLWSRAPEGVKDSDTLRESRFTRLSIASPTTAPYGAAAIEVMKALGIYGSLQPKIVQGNSIAQAFQFIDTGNAELGFIALSQLAGNTTGSRWLVPQSLYRPIRQDAVLLKKGEGNPTATEFLTFLKGPQARTIIERYGYGLP